MHRLNIKLSTISWIASGFLLFALLTLGLVPLLVSQSQQEAAVTEAAVAPLDGLANSTERQLDEVAKNAVHQNAITVRETLRYLVHQHRKQGRKIDWTEEEIHAIAVQQVGRRSVKAPGQGGYTCVYDQSGLMLAHANPSLEGRDMHDLKDKSPSWWAIFSRSLKGEPSEGFYDWTDEDGVTRQKYMVLLPVGKDDLMVATTIYIDEFRRPVLELKARGEGLLSELGRDLRIRARRILVVITMVVVVASLLGGAAVYAFLSWLQRQIGGIRDFVGEVSNQNYGVPPPPLSPVRELQETYEDLETMRSRIIEFQVSGQDQSSFVAATRVTRRVVHDLQDPLRRLKDHSAVIQSEGGDPASLRVITEAVSRLEELLDDVLHPRENHLGHTERLELGSLLQEVSQAFRGNSSRVDVSLKRPQQDLVFVGSRTNLTRVFKNLVRNAIQSIEKEGTIHLELLEEGHNAIVLVRDTGPGIPADIRHVIFDEGFTGRRGGSGLGLAFSREVVREHGGDVDLLDSTPDGSVFRVLLPLPAPTPRKPHTLLVPDGKRLLVLDDSVGILQRWFGLARQAGIEGDYYESFEQARPHLRWGDFTSIYGLVILDHVFGASEYDAIQIAEEIRLRAGTEVRIAICTKNPSAPELVAYKEHTGMPVLRKDYFDELGLVIERSNTG